MPPESSPDVKFEIGHVLFIDIVGYSKLLINQQSEQIQKLKDIARGTEQVRVAEAEGKLLRLPTGDGGALVFRNNPEAPVLCALEIAKALKSHPELRVRMGIHSGPVNEVTDLNAQANIAGAGVNIAQRVMDCGDSGHVLLSKRVADDLEQYPQWRSQLHYLGECEMKHGVRIGVVNLYNDEIGNPQVPKKLRIIRKLRWRSRSVATAAAVLLLTGVIVALVIASKKAAKSTVAIPKKSIAVLPFQNLSRDPDNAYFADGIQEEILTRLSRIRDIKVISRTSTERYKSAPANLLEIARQLGVAHILEGTVQKAADQVRVNVQLIDAETDSHLWAEGYDRRLTDVFAVESEIASKIANTLKAKLNTAEQEALAAQPTNDSEAHQLYLRGRYFWSKQTGADLDKAIDYFSQAIVKDPRYAAAYAGLSDTYLFLPYWTSAPVADCLRKAQAAAEKAMQLDNSLAEPHASLALTLFLAEFDLVRAKREFEQALEANPNYATAHHEFGISVLPALGEIDHAIAELKLAVELDPFSAFINANLGYMYIMDRRYPEAITQLRSTVELNPGYYLSHRCLGQALELSGHLDQAIAEYEKPHEPNDEPYALAYQAHLHGIKGDREKALQLFNQMNDLSRHRTVQPVEIDYAFALAYIGLGNKEEAIHALERAYQNKHYEVFSFVRLDPMLDPLRAEARFQSLVAKVFSGKQ
jgi:TolB-like protein/Tfp pilus assembly protein PilF